MAKQRRFDTHTIVTLARGMARAHRVDHGEGYPCSTMRHVGAAVRVLEYLEEQNFEVFKRQEED